MEKKVCKDGTVKYREMITIQGLTFKSPWSARKTDVRTWKAMKSSERELAKLSGQNVFIQQKISFGEYARNWLRLKIFPNKSKSTASNYESMLRIHCYPVLEAKPLHSITLKDADEIIYNCHLNGNNNRGINHVITLLKQVLNDAEKSGVIQKNPLIHLKKLKVKNEIWKYWTLEEVENFFSQSSDDFYFPLFATAILTGMRRGELAGLKKDCLNFDLNLITVKRTADRNGLKETTKSGKGRHIPMHPLVHSMLRKICNKGTKTDFVFTNPDQTPLNAHHLGRLFDKFQAKLEGVKRIRFHDLRHTFASHFMMKGGHLYVLKELMGHSDVKTTQMYAHLSPDHMKGATDLLQFEGMKTQSNPNLTRDGIIELKRSSESGLSFG